MRRLNLSYLDIRFRIRVTKFKGINLIAEMYSLGMPLHLGVEGWFDANVCNMDRITPIDDPEEIERLQQIYPTVEPIHTETQFIWKVSLLDKSVEVIIDKDKIEINSDGRPNTVEIVNALVAALNEVNIFD